MESTFMQPNHRYFYRQSFATFVFVDLMMNLLLLREVTYFNVWCLCILTYITGGSVCSSPDLDGSKLGTSPQINRFLAREPPDGCEKVLWILWHTFLTVIHICRYNYIKCMLGDILTFLNLNLDIIIYVYYSEITYITQSLVKISFFWIISICSFKKNII